MTTPTPPIKKQAFKGIDLDITHYDTEELLIMLNLTDPTEDDIINATDRLIAKATADRLPKVAAFFQQAQDTLLDELDKQSPPTEEDPKTIDTTTDISNASNQLGQWWRNQNLKQTDKVQAEKPADRNNKLQFLEGNVHMPTKQEKLGVNDTHLVPVVQGTLNPNLKNTITRLVNIDSQYRQIIAPNSENPLGPASPTNYTLDLTENLTNVLSIKLNSIQIPYAWYGIDISSGNNVLFYKLTSDTTYTPFTVPPGNYTPSQLQTYMASVPPFNTIFSVAYNAFNGKMTIINLMPNPYNILFFDPEYNVPVTPTLLTVDINNAIAASKVNSNLGWLMGFRSTNQVPSVPNQISYRLESILLAPENTMTSEAVADTYGPKYVILVLDDYNQNHLNKGLVTIATKDARLSLPSYFTPGLACTCDAVSGTPTYVQSAPRQLTQAQLYTINSINQDRSSTTTDRYTGPTTTDVLALIPVKTFSMTTGQPYIEFGSSLQTNERVYFGPVNIERMKVQLIDDKGNLLNMHGTDWSFTIVSTHLYEY